MNKDQKIMLFVLVAMGVMVLPFIFAQYGETSSRTPTRQFRWDPNGNLIHANTETSTVDLIEIILVVIIYLCFSGGILYILRTKKQVKTREDKSIWEVILGW